MKYTQSEATLEYKEREKFKLEYDALYAKYGRGDDKK